MSVTAPQVCALHGVETRLRCASCETPICLRCQVRTEVGLKCPSCAQPAAGARRQGSRRSPMALAALAVTVAIVLVTAVLVVRSLGSSGVVPPPPPQAAGRWQELPDLSVVRGGTTAVLLRDGRVLAVGGGIGAIPLDGAEIFDPATLRWTRTGSLHEARRGNATALLRDGRVLVTGGVAGNTVLASAEVFDPATGSWSLAAPMHEPRFNHVLTTLPDGRVLAVGGTGSDGVTALASAEVYDPTRNTWTPVPGGLQVARTGARAVLLKDGRVLVAGGASGIDAAAKPLDSAELFDPAGEVFTRTGSLRQARNDLSLTLMADGKVLAAGGSDATGTLGSAEIFDPVVGTWTPTGSMAQPRRLQGASLLPSGKVLVSGGEQVEGGTRTSLTSAELFDPASGSWQPAAAMSCPRSNAAQVTLAGGTVLVLGGDAALPGAPPRAQNCTELYDPTASPA